MNALESTPTLARVGRPETVERARLSRDARDDARLTLDANERGDDGREETDRLSTRSRVARDDDDDVTVDDAIATRRRRPESSGPTSSIHRRYVRDGRAVVSCMSLGGGARGGV